MAQSIKSFVAERLREGMTEEQIIRSFQDKYPLTRVGWSYISRLVRENKISDSSLQEESK